MGGWLTTTVARECLKLLRTRRSRREDPLTDAARPSGDRPGRLARSLGR